LKIVKVVIFYCKSSIRMGLIVFTLSLQVPELWTYTPPQVKCLHHWNLCGLHLVTKEISGNMPDSL